MRSPAALVVAALALGCTLPVAAADSLRSLASRAGIAIGTAVNVDALASDPAYAGLVAREFDLVTPENAMKFSVVHPERERYDFTQADALVAYAAAHGQQVNGHVLVWHQQLPDWLTQGNFSRDELKAILRDHIQTLVTRYRGRVASWDVAAEAVDEDGRLRDTFWSRGIGPDYLTLAFAWAHEADPDVRLRYNDYGGEGLGKKSDGVYHLVAGLHAQGTPIHGVGLQMHVGLDDAPRAVDVRANIARFAALGIDTEITEMDVMLPLPATRQSLSRQATVYRSMLDACLAAPRCRSFSVWGANDRYSWIPTFFRGYGAALPFDADGRSKPAARALRDALHRSHRRTQQGAP